MHIRTSGPTLWSANLLCHLPLLQLLWWSVAGCISSGGPQTSCQCRCVGGGELGWIRVRGESKTGWGGSCWQQYSQDLQLLLQACHTPCSGSDRFKRKSWYRSEQAFRGPGSSGRGKQTFYFLTPPCWPGSQPALRMLWRLYQWIKQAWVGLSRNSFCMNISEGRIILIASDGHLDKMLWIIIMPSTM